jgi:hypothetical protein
MYTYMPVPELVRGAYTKPTTPQGDAPENDILWRVRCGRVSFTRFAVRDPVARPAHS